MALPNWPTQTKLLLSTFFPKKYVLSVCVYFRYLIEQFRNQKGKIYPNNKPGS